MRRIDSRLWEIGDIVKIVEEWEGKMQSRHLSHLVFCVLLATVAQVSAAAPPPMSASTQNDIECLVAIISTAGKIDKIRPGSSQIAMMYYFGRVDSDDPQIDLEAAMRWEISKMTETDISAADVRCGNQLIDRSHVMGAVAKHLESNSASSTP